MTLTDNSSIWLCIFMNVLLSGTVIQEKEEQSNRFFNALKIFQNGVTLLASDCRDMGAKILYNLVHNLRFLHTSVLGESLKGTCAGIPVIIVAADFHGRQASPLSDRVLHKCPSNSASLHQLHV